MSTSVQDERSQPELWRHLWGWTLSALLLVGLSLVGMAWYTGYHEAEEITDAQLMAMARFWLATNPRQLDQLSGPLDRTGVDNYVQDLAVLEWHDGLLVNDTHQMVAGLGLSAAPVPGMYTVNHRGPAGSADWRMYVASGTNVSGKHHVAVLVAMAQRYNLGRDLAEYLARPSVLVLPLVALVLWWTIRRGLRPLDRLSSEVAALDGFAGQRLDTQHRFREFSSTVSAINTLVDTLQTQAQREREFASDVAHELRTPLAAIALQANAAQHDPSPERLARLEHESLRAGRILTQLLELARAQRSGVSETPDGLESVRRLDLGEIAAGLISTHAQQGYESGHELSLVQPDELVEVVTHSMLLELALRNLIENALRHTQPGTQVCVEVWRTTQALGISVSDDGQRPEASWCELAHSRPAPKAAEAGLGLGLRLVERIAEQMGASFRRDTGEPPMTTRFTLHWPR